MEFLSQDDITRILVEAKKSGPREHAMFLLGYLHGLRASEIAGLTLNDIRGGKLRVQRLKHSLKTTQAIETHNNPLYNETAVLEALLADRGTRDDYGSHALFLSRKAGALTRQQVRILFKNICERAGVDPDLAHPHSLKHAAAEHMRQNGVPVEVIRIRLGHRDVRATLRYFHVSDSEADSAMRNTVGRIPA
jgi:type 1 fimbriae regulatory protein FimB